MKDVKLWFTKKRLFFVTLAVLFFAVFGDWNGFFAGLRAQGIGAAIPFIISGVCFAGYLFFRKRRNKK